MCMVYCTIDPNLRTKWNSAKRLKVLYTLLDTVKNQNNEITTDILSQKIYKYYHNVNQFSPYNTNTHQTISNFKIKDNGNVQFTDTDGASHILVPSKVQLLMSETNPYLKVFTSAGEDCHNFGRRMNLNNSIDSMWVMEQFNALKTSNPSITCDRENDGEDDEHDEDDKECSRNKPRRPRIYTPSTN